MMKVLLRRSALAICIFLHNIPEAVSSSESYWRSNANELYVTSNVTISARSNLECAVRCHNSPLCRSFAWEAPSNTCYLQAEVDSEEKSPVYLPVYSKESKYVF